MKSGKIHYIFILVFLLLFIGSVAVMADNVESDLRGFSKEEYKPEDTVSKGLDPNVLFLLDTSTAMAFAPWGVMPEGEGDGRTIEKRAQMLRYNTYGHGMRPVRFREPFGANTTRVAPDREAATGDAPNTTTGLSGYMRYGREISDDKINDDGKTRSEENNRIGDPDCYYTSDPKKPFLLTFKNRHLAHYEGWITPTNAEETKGEIHWPTIESHLNNELPRTGPVGWQDQGGWNWKASWVLANEALVAIRPYIPTQYIKNASGVWIPDPTEEPKKDVVPYEVADEHLVPNDSRLYKMKLALWRMTDPENREMLARMNIASAIGYQSFFTGTDTTYKRTESTNTKVAPYGADEKYPWGVAADYVTGDSTYVTGNSGPKYNDPGVMTRNSQWTRRGLLVEEYRDASPSSRRFKTMSRAIMYHPFNKFYSSDLKPTEYLEKFREFMDGYEHYNKPELENDRPINDEFFAQSLTMLSTAIYGGRDTSEGGNFPYHKEVKAEGKNGWQGENLIQFAVTPKYNAGNRVNRVVYLDPSTNSDGLPTGQAIGSVYDFFSPPPASADTDGFDGVKFEQGKTEGFFPVTGSCQQNWLVVFCAGNSAVPGYEPADAVRRLFHATRTMRGRVLSGDDKWHERTYDMDSGVRTLVVGFIPDPEVGEDPSITEVREQLIAMAQEGDPILSNGEYVANPNATPYFANDVPGLIAALKEVLVRIAPKAMGSGNPVNMPSSVETDKTIIFGASYSMNPLNQWNAWLTKYEVDPDDTSRIIWEVNDEMPSLRKLYTITDAEGSEEMTSKLVNSNSFANANIPADGRVSFDAWLHRYDEDNAELSMGILGDMVNSGITVVGEPKNLPDGKAKDRPHFVYTQTNRGVLHAFDFASGDEKWGFIPPNVFQYKLKGLKFDENGWINGNGFTEQRSIPMYLLDGMIETRDIPSESKTILTGYLGNGGNGLYTMDITDGHFEPNFLWAIENARNKDTTVTGTQTVKRWGAAANGSDSDYDYHDLGLTVVPGAYFEPAGLPVMGSDYNRTIGVLPGGLGHKLGRGGDTQGKAFYFFDPTNGAILNDGKIDTGNFDNKKLPSDAELGMGISPVIYREESKKAVEFFTADSEGNLFACDITQDIGQWKLKSLFRLRTLGTAYEPGDVNIVAPPAAGLPVIAPRKMVYAKYNKALDWLFGGTSDLYGPGSGQLSSNFSEDNSILNKEQFIFGINITNVNSSGLWQNAGGVTPSHENIEKVPYFDDGISSDNYGKYGRSINDYVSADHRGLDKPFGWALRLRPAIEGKTEGEYISAEPFMFNGILYVATFIPRAKGSSDEVCQDIGVGKLYALDPANGYSILDDEPAYVFNNIKIAGFAGMDGQLTISLKQLKDGAIHDLRSKIDVVMLGGGDVAAMIDAPGGDYYDPVIIPFEPKIPFIQYWRERF